MQPGVLTKYEGFTFVLHIINKYMDEPQTFGVSQANASTSLTSMAISASHLQMKMMSSERNHLDDEIKHKLTFYFRNLTPILN